MDEGKMEGLKGEGGLCSDELLKPPLLQVVSLQSGGCPNQVGSRNKPREINHFMSKKTDTLSAIYVIPGYSKSILIISTSTETKISQYVWCDVIYLRWELSKERAERTTTLESAKMYTIATW